MSGRGHHSSSSWLSNNNNNRSSSNQAENMNSESSDFLESSFGQDSRAGYSRGGEGGGESPWLVASNQHEDVCMTPACIKSAAQILNNLDLNANPCDDFYQFACGGWIEQQLIPDDKTALSVFSQNQDDLNVKLRALVERKKTEQDPPIVQQMRNIYRSCNNLTQIELEGDEPLIGVLRQFGGWPVVGASSGWHDNHDNGFDWVDTIIKFRQRGYSHDIIIDLSVVPDVRNNTRFIIDLDQSSLGLPERTYYMKGLNDSTVRAYYNLMVDSAVMLGADRQQARTQLMDVLNFETSLARVGILVVCRCRFRQISARSISLHWRYFHYGRFRYTRHQKSLN